MVSDQLGTEHTVAMWLQDSKACAVKRFVVHQCFRRIGKLVAAYMDPYMDPEWIPSWIL